MTMMEGRACSYLELLRTEAMPPRYIATATYYAHAQNSSCTAAIPIFKHMVEELRHCIATSNAAGSTATKISARMYAYPITIARTREVTIPYAPFLSDFFVSSV